ncbi:unnamed protein product [Dicrocoelium dendriticum]|nr:unnamed protein product [Dicrocoelium dendriticum]
MISRALVSSFKNGFASLTGELRNLFISSKIPPCLIYQHHYTPDKTPPHHNNPEVEKLLKEELCMYPPFQSRKIRLGFQDALMKRDYKRRQVSAHFSDLRLRLVAIKRNTVLPKDIRDTAGLQIASLPRDSNWVRIHSRCVVTSRRRGCKTRWRISRIVWRSYADYNRMSGALWGAWSSATRSERRHMKWPPPGDQSINEYLERYYRNLADS